MKLTPYVVTWIALAAVVLVLALYRTLLALHRDDNLHLAAGEDSLIHRQVAFYRVLDRVDRWGEVLTIVAVGAGVVLAAIYLFSQLPA